jgi:hypothetical protein
MHKRPIDCGFTTANSSFGNAKAPLHTHVRSAAVRCHKTTAGRRFGIPFILFPLL